MHGGNAVAVSGMPATPSAVYCVRTTVVSLLELLSDGEVFEVIAAMIE